MVKRFEIDRQRAALRSLARNPEFLETEEGTAFVEQLGRFTAPYVRWWGRYWEYPLEIDEVTNLVLVHLLTFPETANRIATKNHPWAYLANCARDWASPEWGHRGDPIDSKVATIPAPSDFTKREEEQSLTALVDRVNEILRDRTQADLRSSVAELVEWLMWNPPQRRSYEFVDQRDAFEAFPVFSLRQVRAVTNVVWGGRGRTEETSLVYAVWQNSDFQPSDSPTITRSLISYQKVMNQPQHFPALSRLAS